MQRFEIVWNPTDAYVHGSNARRLMDRHGIGEFGELRRRSVHDPEWFWGAVVDDLGIPFETPYERVRDLSDGLPWARWFVAGKLNLADACVHRWVRQGRADTPAVRWVAEDGETAVLSYGELSARVRRLAEVLAGMGVQAGDRVAVFLPMVPAAVTALYAVAHLGAVYVPIFSGFSAPAVAVRLRDAGARVLITADGAYRRGRVVAMKDVADTAVDDAPGVERVLVVRRTGQDVPLRGGRDADLDALVAGAAPDHPTAFVDAEHPVMLAYTSGTTGRPKGAVHVHGGFTVKIAAEVAYQVDLRRDSDLLHWVTDMGWIMGPWEVVGAHALGGTVLLSEGAPDHPRPDRLWQLVAASGVTILGVSPTLIRALQGHGDTWVDRHDVSCLRVLASTGEPWNPQPWHWLFEVVGRRRCPIINLSGGTEVGACFLSPHPLEPIKPTSLGGPALGMDVDVVDPDGRPVRGQVGELVCRSPWPGMTRGLWNDRQRYLDTYWSRFEGMWWHGDFASVDADGFWYLHGRSDDTITVAGKRVGPAEIESVLVGHDAVREAAAVGLPDPVKGEAIHCFVLLNPGIEPSEDLRAELGEAVTAGLGRPFRPQRVGFVDDLPRTRSAKIVRRAVRAVLQREDPGDVATLENPAALDAVRAAH